MKYDEDDEYYETKFERMGQPKPGLRVQQQKKRWVKRTNDAKELGRFKQIKNTIEDRRK